MIRIYYSNGSKEDCFSVNEAEQIIVENVNLSSVTVDRVCGVDEDTDEDTDEFSCVWSVHLEKVPNEETEDEN
jgi:hypothetical protein